MPRNTGAGRKPDERKPPKTRADVANARAASGTVVVAPRTRASSALEPQPSSTSSTTLREVAAPAGAVQGVPGKTISTHHAQAMVPMPPEAMRTLRATSAAPDGLPAGGRYSLRAAPGGRTEMPLAPATIAPHAWSPPAATVEEAARHHEVAVALIRRRRWDHALEEALRAVHLNSGNPEYETTYAWILYQAGPPRRETDAQISAHLNRALKLDRECAQAHYVLGLLRKRQSKHEAAEAHFRMALDSDPEHLEATREMRLYSKRRVGRAESGLVQRLVESFTGKRGRTPSRPADDD